MTRNGIDVISSNTVDVFFPQHQHMTSCSQWETQPGTKSWTAIRAIPPSVVTSNGASLFRSFRHTPGAPPPRTAQPPAEASEDRSSRNPATRSQLTDRDRDLDPVSDTEKT